MDEGELDMLDATIAAHHAWLNEEGVALHRDPGCLTAAAALAHMGPIRAQSDVKAQLLRTAALENLVDLCGLRTRAIGLPQVSAMLAAQMKDSIEHRSRWPTKRERLEAKAIQAVHDNRHAELTLERSRTASDRLRTFQRSLIDENRVIDGRWRKLQRAECGDVGLPGLATAKIENLWIRSRTEAYLADLKWYEGQLHGAASTSALGCPSDPDAKAWHDRLGRCVLRAKDAGATRTLLRRLFPDNTLPGQRLEADRKPRGDIDQLKATEKARRAVRRADGKNRKRAQRAKSIIKPSS